MKKRSGLVKMRPRPRVEQTWNSQQNQQASLCPSYIAVDKKEVGRSCWCTPTGRKDQNADKLGIMLQATMFATGSAKFNGRLYPLSKVMAKDQHSKWAVRRKP